MTGGRNIPPIDAAGSMAPATCGLKPARFIKGMVKAPVETVLAIALPETDPKKADAMTATLAGPPVVRPARARGKSMKNLPGSRFVQKGAKEDKQDDVGRQDVGHDPENPVGCQVKCGTKTFDAEASMGNDLRENWPEVSVEEHADADKGHRPTQNTTTDFEREDDADDTDHGVQVGFCTGPVVEDFKFVDPVVNDCNRGQRVKDVREGRVFRPFFHHQVVDESGD